MTALPAFVVAETAAFLLAITRVGGFVLVSPFPGTSIPANIKIGLVLMLAFLARATNPATSGPPLQLDMSLIGLVPAELGIGLVIGFTMRVTFSAAEMLGNSIAQSTGLTMGAVYDPTLGSEDPLPARIITLLGMLLFVGLGAHRVAIGYTLESFRALPIGHGASIGAAAPAFFEFLTQAMEVGVRLSLPVMGVALGVHIALALVARASPSLQIFSIGLGVTVAAGILAMIGSLTDVGSGIGVALEQGGPRIERVLSDVAQP